MPCDTIRLNRVDIKKMHTDGLKAAVAQMKGTLSASGQITLVTGRYAIQNGKLVGLDGQERDVVEQARNALCRGYSGWAVAKAAKAMGWQIQRTASDQLVLRR